MNRPILAHVQPYEQPFMDQNRDQIVSETTGSL